MKYRILAFGFLLVCLVTTAALLHHNSLANSRSTVKNDQAVIAVDDSPVEVEVLTLDRRGFEPAEIRRPLGRFMLAISAHTEDQQLTLELNRLAGGRIHAVNMARGRARSLEDLDLPVGEYLLTATNHPELSCRIVISPR